jgi:hypothetical protein
MKNILYFDCYSGVAGDMILAALLDLDLDLDRWLSSLNGLSVSGWEVRFDRVIRQGITGMKVDIVVSDKQPHRHLKDISEIIEGSDLSVNVKNNALKTFTILAEAEAKVHRCDVEKVHFHEVGAVDAIVDIVGTCLALDQLNVGEIYASPVGVGKGMSKCNHGPMPLPPPATLEILRGCPLHFHDVETELATPTGTALLKALCYFELPPPGVSLLKVGSGAGSKEITKLPNLLRALLLSAEKTMETDSALVLETNIDDMNPEIYPYVVERLLDEGAMDAFLAPLVMKKGRPGVMLSVLCSPELKSKMIDVIYRETSTLGIRISSVERLKLPRKPVEIETPWGKIKGKKSTYGDRVFITPEYDDCRRLSREKGIPLQEIYRAFSAALTNKK